MCFWSVPGPIERKDARLYPLAGLEDVPASAREQGAGVKTKAIPPDVLAQAILHACEKRRPEIVMPGKARCFSHYRNFGRAWAIGSCGEKREDSRLSIV